MSYRKSKPVSFYSISAKKKVSAVPKELRLLGKRKQPALVAEDPISGKPLFRFISRDDAEQWKKILGD